MPEITEITTLEQGAKLTSILDINNTSTVQALSLLRIGVFIPIKRVKLKNGLDRPVLKSDVSDEFRKLEFARTEGFENVMITGPALNFETDFRVWCGVIRAFNTYGYNSAKITFSFQEFAKSCGFTSKQLDERLRKRIHDALVRIRGQVMEFTKPQVSKSYIGGLLASGGFDAASDTIELVADPKLWELYSIDHQVLLKLNVLSKLNRYETAQCLYAYLSALPQNPAPVSFARLRDRLCLTSSVKEQNRAIKKALDKLKSIGFLLGDIVRKDGENYLILHSLSQKLALKKD
ncbi:RepB family plasmid replication initiator protein [Pseudoalteromonas galatheae]|uniref:RepB family plasmid replication initiator protein n=1 Tax=Pseudoalteromonas galatheae TaxID=579562 RepID=UPI0030CFE320